MTALAKPKKTLELNGESVVPKIFDLPVAADAVIHSGALVVIDAGYADAASTATGKIAAGVAQESRNNTDGDDGDLRVRVLAGCFKFANSASSDEITQTELGTDCYIVDDQTVAKTDGSGTRSLAGRIVGVDTDGVWVLVGITGPASPASTLVQGGTTTLVSGTKSVTGVTLTANSRIMATRKTKGGTEAGVLEVPSASRNTGAGSFVINALDPSDGTVATGDTSTVDWLIFG